MGLKEILENAPSSDIPKTIKPMMATLIREPFNSADYFFEIKWDGYRAIAEKGTGINLYSRNLKPFNFPEISGELGKIPHEIVLDGEIVALDSRGMPSFEQIQNYHKSLSVNLVYYIFDVIYLDGKNLAQTPLEERKAVLKAIIPKESSRLKESEYIEEYGEAFFSQIKQLNLEGMVAKKKDSFYREGKRTKDWLKIKTHLSQEAVIGGFTDPRGGRLGFGSLILGVYDNGRLIYIGNAGGGFNDRSLANLKEKLGALEISSSPFFDYKKGNSNHWVQPKLVAEVKFAEWTKDGHMRQPVFLGIRSDKNPQEVVREVPKNVL